jgi:2'-5' RNA ligase
VRLFTAIELGNEARAEIAAAGAELRRRIAAKAPRARLTWVAPERLHLTVRFIGEADESQAARIVAALRDPLPFPPFSMSLDRFGGFPASGPPRVLWVGVGTGADSVVQGEAAISDRLAALGLAREERAYRPHLTLARVRDAAGLRTAWLFEGLRAPSAPTAVDAITLFQSRLSPKGPTYTVVERIRFVAD